MWVNIKLNDEALLPRQAMALNVAANKEQLIRTFAGPVSVETDRTEWKTLSGNRT